MHIIADQDLSRRFAKSMCNKCDGDGTLVGLGNFTKLYIYYRVVNRRMHVILEKSIRYHMFIGNIYIYKFDTHRENNGFRNIQCSLIVDLHREVQRYCTAVRAIFCLTKMAHI